LAGDGGDTDEVDLGAADGEQYCQGVVQAGVGVDDHRDGH